MTNYHSIKQLIDKIDKLAYSEHHDIFNILRTHNLNYSKNNNGCFFDFQKLDEAVLQELSEYIQNIEKQSQTINDKKCVDDMNKQIDEELVKENNDNDKKLINTSTLTEECTGILIKLNIENEIELDPLINMIEKDKCLHKRGITNRFTMAKKKYSKPVVIESKYTLSDLLTHDNT
tara:strand:+ start:2187 stop:2714 length:528 start_codon:yes stop_codon:yes gene_type:complete